MSLISSNVMGKKFDLDPNWYAVRNPEYPFMGSRMTCQSANLLDFIRFSG
jgi:hypothetical protein